MADEPNSIKTLKAYSRSDLGTTSDLRAALNSLKDESDRAYVILSAAIVEDKLLGKIKGRLTPFADGAAYDRLFNFEGPLGSFGERIDMAGALGVIDDDTREALHLVRHMRNACAHAKLPISFMTPALWNVAERLITRERGTGRFRDALGRDRDDTRVRRLFFRLEINQLWLTISLGSYALMAEEMARIADEMADEMARENTD